MEPTQDARFVVREGPRTWIVFDTRDDHPVSETSWPQQERAQRMADQLNQTHRDYNKPY